MKKNIFADYDEQILPPTRLEQRTRDMMLLGSGWTKKDGSVSGVFDSRAPHSCIWSCRWSTKGGVLAPKTWYPQERMKSFELAAEATDMLGQFPDNLVIDDLVLLMTPYYLETIKNHGQWLTDVQRIIRKARVLYKEYSCLWTQADHVYVSNYRPGWPSPPKPKRVKVPPTKHGSRPEPPLGMDPDSHRRVN